MDDSDPIMGQAASPALAQARDLATELRRRVEHDQTVRAEGFPDRILAADRDNVVWLRAVIRRHGWPGISLVGEAGGKDAWLLILHADKALIFQRQCLHLLMEAVDQGEAPAWQVAYLIDRVLMHQGMKQRYATQYRRPPDGAEGWEPLPVEDPSGLDSRRANLGLPPMAEAGVHKAPPDRPARV